MRAVGDLQPRQAREREHARVVGLLVDLPDAGLDVAADGPDDEVGPLAEELSAAAEAARADRRAGREVRQRVAAGADPGVARVRALGRRANGEAGGVSRGEVFEGVDGEVDAAVQQRRLQLGRE